MITSKLLSSLGIVHGYSTRNQVREDFLNELNVHSVTIAQQVHGIKIALVTEQNRGQALPGFDGLVSTGAPLGVTFADCVPILAVDPAARIIGTAHAGWKGTLAGIASELIRAMREVGANNIYVSVGPHIGMCCYNILEDRARLFLEKYTDEKIISKIGGVWHLDIGYANYQQLVDAGVPKDHIDAPVVCTSCQVSQYNSFRADPKEKFGVQLGVISLQ